MNRNLKFFNYLIVKSRFNNGRLIIQKLLNNKDHSRHYETPNYYTGVDMGYKIINKQKIKVKMIRDTAGLTIYDLKDYKFI